MFIAFALLYFFTLNMSAQPFSSQSQWEKYFNDKILSLDPIEGIWSVDYEMIHNFLIEPYSESGFTKIAIYKQGNNYVGFIFGDNFKDIMTWKFENTASNAIFLFEARYKYTAYYAKTKAIMPTDGLLELSFKVPDAIVRKKFKDIYENGLEETEKYTLVKISPKKTNNLNPVAVSGTGFGISSNGIIVTNHHVIDGTNSIKVKGVNSDFNKAYKAKLLVSDKNNDLALIQIDDYNFTSAGSIPYTIKTSLAGVGENIFVLGYPLRATIKLTNGIISSKTGFQGDISSYQISAPVQPGNSGGPLFDNKGNLIGIINAKHGGAENASYAVKSSYLTNLLELLPSPPKLNSTNSLAGKSLTQQVEIAKKFVYIIEAE